MLKRPKTLLEALSEAIRTAKYRSDTPHAAPGLKIALDIVRTYQDKTVELEEIPKPPVATVTVMMSKNDVLWDISTGKYYKRRHKEKV